jgi:hypothetical protein
MMICYFMSRPLESLALQGFKITNPMVGSGGGSGGYNSRIPIYNDNYKLNIVEN